MTEEPEAPDATSDALREKAHRVRTKRGKPATIFAHLAHVGVLGWVFILPVIGLTYAGHLAGRATGERWPAVAGLLAGVALGAYLTWRNVRDGLRGSDGEEADR